MIKIRRRFKPGRIFSSRRVADVITKSIDYQEWVEDCLNRYTSEDWGSLGDNDKTLSNEAVKNRERVMARYANPEGNILIITEAGSTIVLLQEEY